MIELTKHEGVDPQINSFEWVSPDASLSQFKHHFVLRRVHIPKLQFADFATAIYRGFRTPLVGPQSIYVVQIMESYDNSIYDFAVGFRRNSEAIAVYKNTKKFYTPTKESDIELAEAFKLYLEALLPQQSPKKQQKLQTPSWQHTDSREDEGSRSRRRNNPSPRLSVSRSRSRSRDRGEECSKFYLALLPFEIKRDRLQQRIAEYADCPTPEVVVQDQRLEFPCVGVTIKQGGFDYANFYKCIPEALLIRQDQTRSSNLRLQVRRRQMRAVKQGVYRPTEQTFLELAHWLVGCRGDVKVLHILFQDSSFLVTVAGRLNLRELRLGGWKFEYVHHTPRMTPSLQDRWYTFLDKHYGEYLRLPLEQ